MFKNNIIDEEIAILKPNFSSSKIVNNFENNKEMRISIKSKILSSKIVNNFENNNEKRQSFTDRLNNDKTLSEDTLLIDYNKIT